MSAGFSFSAAKQDYWHASDSYSIELDGEGDAFVLATLDLESISGNEVPKISLEIPYEQVQIYKVAQGYYDSADFVDFEATGLSDSTLVTITLRNALAKNQRTTIAIIYQVPAVAKPGLRGYSFRFESMKDRSALVRSIGVNVAVPENMFLKGKGEADVRYKPSLMMEGVSAKTMIAESMPYGGYVPPAMHSAKNVDPGESFVVEGLYGKSQFLLYLPEIVISLFGLVFLVLLARIFSIGDKVRSLISGGVQKSPIPSGAGFNFFRAIFLGGASSVSLTLVYFATDFIGRDLNTANSDLRGILQLLFLLLVVLLVLLSFALPAHYGFRNSWMEGIAVFLFTIVFTLLIFFFLSGGSQPIYSGGNYPTQIEQMAKVV